MRFDEPRWWYGPAGSWPARALAPAAAIVAQLAARRLARAMPYRATLPVICIGNFTAGGTGKTPLALHVAELLHSLGRRPAFLTRGYGGRIAGPHRVDLRTDTARTVGDEPLLLARKAPTIVARDRAAGARFIEALATADIQADVILMDDGLQNPQLAKDLTIAVVDGRRGFGNGLVLPAGPLRAPLEFQLSHIDAIVVNGSANGGAAAAEPDVAQWLRTHFEGPVLSASVRPVPPLEWLGEGPLVAYCGIGAPQRFLDLLRSLGASLAAVETFPDHHPFTVQDAARLLALAERYGARLVTTEKDLIRLHGTRGALVDLMAASRPLAIAAHLDAPDATRLAALVEGVLRTETQPR